MRETDPLNGEIRVLTPAEIDTRRFDRRINWATAGLLVLYMVSLALIFLAGVLSAKWGWL